MAWEFSEYITGNPLAAAEAIGYQQSPFGYSIGKLPVLLTPTQLSFLGLTPEARGWIPDCPAIRQMSSPGMLRMAPARGAPLDLRVEETLGPEWIERALREVDRPHTAIVIRGGSGLFCKGLPLERAAENTIEAPRAVRTLAHLLGRLSAGPSPVIAVVEGDALGGGVGLAAVADFTIASPAARFQLPEVLFGLIPAAVLPYIAVRTGWAAARRMALADTAIDAVEALRIGLVDAISDDPERELAARLARLRRAEPGAVAVVRQLAANRWPVDDAIEAFATLWNGAARARIERFANGETPWEDEE
jgi:enoyl-CoA hydratase/carnithine racemase